MMDLEDYSWQIICRDSILTSTDSVGTKVKIGKMGL